jgi:hypothetical protein
MTTTAAPAQAQLVQALAALDDLDHHITGHPATWLHQHLAGEKHNLQLRPGDEGDAHLLAALHDVAHQADLATAHAAVAAAETAMADDAAHGDCSPLEGVA